MKRMLVLLVVMLFLPVVALADEQCDFRDVKWGMSIEDVKKAEKAEKFKEDENNLAYSVNILGEDALLLYAFSDNKLCRARYALLKHFTNQNNKYHESFIPLVESLQEKYGKPKKHNKIWRNSLFKGDKDAIGVAIATGGYSEYVFWVNEKTDIVAYITGENHDIDCGVEYSSKEFMKIERNNKKKRDLKKL